MCSYLLSKTCIQSRIYNSNGQFSLANDGKSNLIVMHRLAFSYSTKESESNDISILFEEFSNMHNSYRTCTLVIEKLWFSKYIKISLNPGSLVEWLQKMGVREFFRDALRFTVNQPIKSTEIF